MWQKAAALAAKAHAGQVRKDGVTPYISHPFRVAMTVRHVFGEDDVTAITAALLHDTIEDCAVDYDEIADDFGTEVADVVAALTKDMRLPDDLREPEYDKVLAASSWQAKLVKLADVYDNYSDVLNDAARNKAAEKARRAIAIAESESKCQQAVGIVKALIGD